jgi:hypothetical protein
MSSATPTPQDAGLPPPASLPTATFSDTTSTFSDNTTTNEDPTEQTTPFANPADPSEVTTTIDTVVTANKPTILHLGDDIRWNHEMYVELGRKFHIERSHSMGRDEFMKALRERKWGNFVGMYRPFWNTGGEMGNWNEDLM